MIFVCRVIKQQHIAPTVCTESNGDSTLTMEHRTWLLSALLVWWTR